MIRLDQPQADCALCTVQAHPAEQSVTPCRRALHTAQALAPGREQGPSLLGFSQPAAPASLSTRAASNGVPAAQKGSGTGFKKVQGYTAP